MRPGSHIRRGGVRGVWALVIKTLIISSEYWTIPCISKKRGRSFQVITPPASQGNACIQLVKPVGGDVCSVGNLELNMPVPEGHQIFKGQVPDVRPVFVVKIRNILKLFFRRVKLATENVGLLQVSKKVGGQYIVFFADIGKSMERFSTVCDIVLGLCLVHF